MNSRGVFFNNILCIISISCIHSMYIDLVRRKYTIESYMMDHGKESVLCTDQPTVSLYCLFCIFRETELLLNIVVLIMKCNASKLVCTFEVYLYNSTLP